MQTSHTTRHPLRPPHARPSYRRRILEAGAVRRADVAVRGRRRDSDSGHAGADHAADVRGDARRSYAAVASGRRRRRHLSGGGAVGLPVFAGGTSTLALVGRAPASSSASCRVWWSSPCCAASPTLRPSRPPRAPRAATCWPRWSGGVVVVYAFGFVIQSALTGAPLAAVALASMGSWVGDAIKGRGGLSCRRRPVQARSLT